MIGSDTWVNQRWQAYGELMKACRVWLGDLPPDVTRNIGCDNAARLFGVRWGAASKAAACKASVLCPVN